MIGNARLFDKSNPALVGAGFTNAVKLAAPTWERVVLPNLGQTFAWPPSALSNCRSNSIHEEAMSNHDLDPTTSRVVLGQSTWHYARTARWLHWSLAVLLVGQVGLGWYMMSVEDQPGSERFFDLHKSAGLVLAGLIVWRSAWRLGHRPAELPPSVPRWQAKAAWASHWALYGCMLLLPITGYVGASFSSRGVTFLGWSVPTVGWDNRAVRELFFAAHSAIAVAMVIVVALHVMAAVKHLVIDRDNVFERMLLRR